MLVYESKNNRLQHLNGFPAHKVSGHSFHGDFRRVLNAYSNDRGLFGSEFFCWHLKFELLESKRFFEAFGRKYDFFNSILAYFDHIN